MTGSDGDRGGADASPPVRERLGWSAGKSREAWAAPRLTQPSLVHKSLNVSRNLADIQLTPPPAPADRVVLTPPIACSAQPRHGRHSPRESRPPLTSRVTAASSGGDSTSVAKPPLPAPSPHGRIFAAWSRLHPPPPPVPRWRHGHPRTRGATPMPNPVPEPGPVR